MAGSIEFWETHEQALHREFMEEPGIEISITGPWHTIENIFEFNGAQVMRLFLPLMLSLRILPSMGEEISTIETGYAQRVIWATLTERDRSHLKPFQQAWRKIVAQASS